MKPEKESYLIISIIPIVAAPSPVIYYYIDNEVDKRNNKYTWNQYQPQSENHRW
jgi:hypothetical protein